MRKIENRGGAAKSMKGVWLRRCGAMALVCGLVSTDPFTAHAAPLDPQACEQLQLKLDELRKGGVEADMAMGVEKARSSLPIERFNRIGTYIEVDEQLNFRCGLAKQRIVLPTTVEGGEEEIPAPATATGADGNGKPPPGSPAAKGAAAAKGSPPAKRRPADAKAKDASASNAAATAAPAAKPASPDGAPRKAAKKKAAAKKPDDAYRPPPKPVAGSEKKEPATKQ
jgi:hypothetical protein